jgi:23S rRNA pseudouridine1911/1915/1917 synthase
MTRRTTDDGAGVRFEVTAAEAGERLDVVVAARLDVSRSRAVARLTAGEVRLDGAPGRKQDRVHAGQVVEVVAPVPVTPPAAPPLPPIAYRDEHLLVVAKPAGLVVHPGHGHVGDTLVDALQAAGIPLAPSDDPTRPGIVHRLDRDTSGLLVVASSPAAHAGLVAALRRREVRRRYLALVAGVPREARGRIEAPIGRDPSDRTRFAVVADGREATTRYRVLATGQASGLSPDASAVALLGCGLETGRTHQLRVHLTRLGTPIVGDAVYGPRPTLAAALGLTRPFLHAAALAFDHPVTGERVAVTRPLPDELVAALERAGVPVPSPDALG